MELRELLQKEVWSKRTSRKIFIGFGIVIIGFSLWIGINRYWITPRERSTAREALIQIDALQHFSVMSDTEYEAKERQAKEKVDMSVQAAWTSRDKSMASSLSGYLLLTDMERSDQKQRARMMNSSDERVRKVMSLDLHHDSQSFRDFLNQTLHIALGN